MSRRQYDSANLTPQQVEAAIKRLMRQIHDLALQREIASYDGEQRTEDIHLSDPHALEYTLMERLASLRRLRSQRRG